MKKIIYFFMFLVIVSFLCCNNNEKTIKIGVISPMTGAGAACCQYWINGFNMAIEQINKEGIHKYEIIFEDCQSDAAKAISCFKRLEMQDVKYIVAVGGQFAMAVAPLTKGKDIIYFTTSDYNEAVLKETDCGFRIYPSAQILANTASDYFIQKLNINKIATITLNTVPNLIVKELFSKQFTEKGGNVNFSDTYNIGQYDFKEIVSKLSTKDIQGIFFTGFGTSAFSFCNQLASNPHMKNIVVLGDVNLSTENFISNNKNNNISIFYADSKLSNEFEDIYHTKYKSESNSLSSCSYIIPFIIKETREAVENSNNIKSQINYIRNRNFHTAIGDIYFDNIGNCSISMQVYELK